MNRFIATNPTKCIGCRTCEVACALAHSNAGVEGLTPATFQPRLKVIKTLDVSSPVMCHHCEDAPCANACPANAIVYQNNSVQVLQQRCVGCKSCVMACPFGAMDVVTVPATRQFAGIQISVGVKAQAHKCDLCSGKEAGPACVAACPTEALHLMDQNSMEEAMQLRRTQSLVNTPSIS